MPLSCKVKFPVTSKPTRPTVFNLQASDWVHCEDETGAHTHFPRQTNKVEVFLNICYSCSFCCKKIHAFQNIA